MKTYTLVISVLVLMVSLVTQACGREQLKESEVLITGSIQKQERYGMREAYVRLVLVEVSKDKLELSKVTALRDIHNELVGVECVSDHPMLRAPSDYRFRHSIQAPNSGRYILALQHTAPQGVERLLWTMRPLGRNGKRLVVENIPCIRLP